MYPCDSTSAVGRSRLPPDQPRAPKHKTCCGGSFGTQTEISWVDDRVPVVVMNELQYHTSERVAKMATRHGKEMEAIQEEMTNLTQLHGLEIESIKAKVDKLHEQHRKIPPSISNLTKFNDS